MYALLLKQACFADFELKKNKKKMKIGCYNELVNTSTFLHVYIKQAIYKHAM